MVVPEGDICITPIKFCYVTKYETIPAIIAVEEKPVFICGFEIQFHVKIMEKDKVLFNLIFSKGALENIQV